MTVEEIKVVLRIELEKSFRYIKHIQLRTNRYNNQREYKHQLPTGGKEVQSLRLLR